MKFVIFAFIVFFAAAVATPVYAQNAEADAKLLQQTPADEDGWAAADNEEDLDDAAHDAGAPFQQEQNPHDALRTVKTVPAAKGAK